MFFLLLATILFLLAFVFLIFSHEYLKKQIRRISAKTRDDPAPRELDYPFFRIAVPEGRYLKGLQAVAPV